MKTYIGQKGRDRIQRLWVESHGRRSPLPGDDVAGRILADVFGARVLEEDYRCYQEFRDEVIAPRLDDATWSLTETEVRDWKDTYHQRFGRPAKRTLLDSDTEPEPDSDTDPSARPSSLDTPQELSEDAPRAQPEDVAPRTTDDTQHTLVSWGTGITRAKLLRTTPGVLLLEGDRPPGSPLPAGAPLRVGLPGRLQMVPGRLAAYGQQNRFLIALGSRAVRGAARARVDLRAVAQSGQSGQSGGRAVRVVDLSSSGARVRGTELGVGSDFDLSFVPPGRHDLVTVRCVVVRVISGSEPIEVGVAFCGGALSFRVDLTQARATT